MNGPPHKERGCWCRHDEAHYRKPEESESGAPIGCRECDRHPVFDLPELRTVSEDRRRYARLNLDQPIRTSMANAPAHVVDASIAGLGLAHQEKALPVGSRCRLMFHSEFGPITVECEVKRSAPRPSTEEGSWQTGLEIIGADPESSATLRRLLMAIATRHPNKSDNNH